MKMTKSKVEFYIGDKKYNFSVVHNLSKTFGVSLECALDNWLARTDKYTAASLCKYVMSKGEPFVCMTEASYNRMFGQPTKKQKKIVIDNSLNI